MHCICAQFCACVLAQPNWKFWLHSWLFTFQLCVMYCSRQAKPNQSNRFHSTLRTTNTTTIFYYRYWYCYHHFYYNKSMKHTVFALGKLRLFYEVVGSAIFYLFLYTTDEAFSIYFDAFFLSLTDYTIDKPNECMDVCLLISLSLCVYSALDNSNRNIKKN